MKQFLLVVAFGIAVAGSIWVWTRPRNQPIDASSVVTVAREIGAKAREVVSDAARPLARQPHQDAYDLVCADIRKNLLSPSTASFSVLGKDEEAVIESLGRDVYRASGFVDSQNFFSAMIRKKWSMSFQVEGGKISKEFFCFFEGDPPIGNDEDAARVAKGFPTVAEEKEEAAKASALQLTKDKQAAEVRRRPELHKAAQEQIARDWKLPSTAKFSTLQVADDQWTICRKILGEPLWVAGGVVDPAGTGTNRLNWTAVCSVRGGDTVIVDFSRLGSRTMGNAALEDYAQVAAGNTSAEIQKQDGSGAAKVAESAEQKATAEKAGVQSWHTPRPPYPAAALAARFQGSGAVRVSTDASGNVASAVITSPINPILDSNTRSFARSNWKGPPNQTRTVPVTYQIR